MMGACQVQTKRLSTSSSNLDRLGCIPGGHELPVSASGSVWLLVGVDDDDDGDDGDDGDDDIGLSKSQRAACTCASEVSAPGPGSSWMSLCCAGLMSAKMENHRLQCQHKRASQNDSFTAGQDKQPMTAAADRVALAVCVWLVFCARF